MRTPHMMRAPAFHNTWLRTPICVIDDTCAILKAEVSALILRMRRTTQSAGNMIPDIVVVEYFV